MSDYKDYDDLIDRITDALSDSNAQYDKVGSSASSPCEINNTISQYSNMDVVRNNDGKIIGYDYRHPYPTTPDTDVIGVDSNTDTGSFGSASGGGGKTRGGGAGRFAGSYYSGQTYDAPMISGGLDKDGQQVNLLSGFLDAGWAACNALAKFGKNAAATAADFIESTGVDFKANFAGLTCDFSSQGMATNLANVIRGLFGVKNDGTVSMYLDEDTLAALAITLKDNGAFSTGDYVVTDTTVPGTSIQVKHPLQYTVTPHVEFVGATPCYCWAYYDAYADATHSTGYDAFICDTVPHMTGWGGYAVVAAWADNPGTVKHAIMSLNRSGKMVYRGGPWGVSIATRTYDGKTVYYGAFSTGGLKGHVVPISASQDYGVAAWEMIYGNASGGPAPEGITTQDGATVPVDAITGADPHVVAAQLADQYPDVMGDPVQIVVINDNCEEETINYYEVPVNYSPTDLTINAPVNATTQNNPSFNPSVGVDLPDINLDHLVDQIIQQLQGTGSGPSAVNTNPDTNQPTPPSQVAPATGTGDTPDPEMPEASVTAMWHVYNPSSAELSALGSWLWSANIIDQIQRLFSNPLDAIIGVHAVYGEPSVSGSAGIVVGNLTASVSARVVSRQYANVDCGSVWLTEYYGNVFDYEPYTSVSLFLPFIGIVGLSVADVMRSQISVKYTIDVYTGACLAMVSVSRDGVGGVMYQYAGNCAVSYPVSGASYNSIYGSIISAAAGIAMIAGTGGAGAGAVAGATSALSAPLSASVNVHRSGGFSGNSGAMGIKKPYLIISRPIPEMALNFEYYDGRGANKTGRIGEQSGYIKCKEIHLNIPNAYKDELDELEEILKSGVVL